MKRLESPEQYEAFVAEVAEAAWEMAAEWQSAAAGSVVQPTQVGGEMAWLFNGEPYTKTRVDPLSVIMLSDQETPPDVEGDVFGVAVAMLAADLEEYWRTK